MNIHRHRDEPTTYDISRGKVFAGCTSDQRRRLDALSTAVTVRAGRDLTVQGSRGREFGVILEGEAIVAIDGNEVARLAAGDHYGELALLDDPVTTKGRRATVTTTVETTVAAMTVAEFQTVLHDMPEVAARIMQTAFARASY
jgi:CRP/FNR family transcriptional regulator, cyclic AMP receptor protein